MIFEYSFINFYTMFDFEKLEVYKIAKSYNKEVRLLIKLIPDKVIRDQLSRA